MASLHLPTIWASTLTAATIFIVAFISKWLRKPRSFNVPVVGAEAGDVNALKSRYVQEADALLREGHEKVECPTRQIGLGADETSSVADSW